jgi:uncharacterized protein (TIGR03435 family)
MVRQNCLTVNRDGNSEGQSGFYTHLMAVSRWFAFVLLAYALLGACHASAQQAPAAATVEPRPSFEVASIKPSRPDDQSHNWNSSGDRVSIENYTLRRLIRTAYGLKSDSQVLGGPEWIAKQAFDIEAKFGDAEVTRMQKMSGREKFQEATLALRALLVERFQLRVVQETRSIPVYALVVAKTGVKLASSAPQLDEDGKPKADQNHSIHDSNGHVTAKAFSMSGFADWLTLMPDCDRVVVNRTGLSGEYDFKLDWTEDYGEGVPPDAPLPGLFTALREQLGLELKSDKAPLDVVVVDAAKEPDFD